MTTWLTMLHLGMFFEAFNIAEPRVFISFVQVECISFSQLPVGNFGLKDFVKRKGWKLHGFYEGLALHVLSFAYLHHYAWMFWTTFKSTSVYFSDLALDDDDESMNALVGSNMLVHSLKLLKEFSDKFTNKNLEFCRGLYFKGAICPRIKSYILVLLLWTFVSSNQLDYSLVSAIATNACMEQLN